jgi:hypothetical protein
MDDTPKLHIGFHIAADVVNTIRATGRGYNAPVEKVLRDALAKRSTKRWIKAAVVEGAARGPDLEFWSGRHIFEPVH